MDTFDQSIYDEVMADQAKLRPSNPTVKENGVEKIDPMKWIDPDTFKVGNITGRTTYSAPEIAHTEKGLFTPPEYQGASAEIPRILSEQGFNNLVKKGSGGYNRGLYELETDQGQKASTFVTQTGLAPVNAFTPEEDINKKLGTSAFSRLYPEMAEQDPVLRTVNQYRRKELADAAAGNRELYKAKIEVQNAPQYQAFKKSIGRSGENSAAKEIVEVENMLKEPNLKQSARDLLDKRLETARKELFYAATTPDYVGNVNYLDSDRNIMNQSKNSFTDSMAGTWYGSILKGVGGIGEQSGEALKWDWLKNKGRDYATQSGLTQDSLPSVLSNFTDIQTDQGAWHTVKDTSQWAFNNLGSMVPYVAGVTLSGIGAAAVAPGAITAGILSVMPMALINSGAYYHDQPQDKKNSSLALAAGTTSSALDKLGLTGIMGKGFNAFTLTGFKELTTALVSSGKAATLADARKMVSEATKREVIGLSEFGEKLAKSQYMTAASAARGAGVLADEVLIDNILLECAMI